MRTKQLEDQKQMLLDLVAHAIELGGWDDFGPREVNAFIEQVNAVRDNGTKEDLVALTHRVQQVVRLDLYTSRMAAAWLGMSVRGVRTAVDGGRLHPLKLGHDLVYVHSDLEQFHQNRRYALKA